MFRTIFTTAVLVAGVSACAAAGSATSARQPAINLTAGPAVSKELTAQITQLDAALFASIFDNCNAERVGEMVTDDFEFYHDKWGLTATSKQQFVESIAGMCKRIQDGTDFRARRELVADTLRVYPLNNFGAVETGYHKFYALMANGPDKLTETAQFTQVWKNDNGVWKLARVISFDHQLAQ